MSATSHQDTKPLQQQQRVEVGDCALVEIIHLHDCFRGALEKLESDVAELCREVSCLVPSDRVTDLQGRVAGRFSVIWTVFKAHSSAEDEFIWPALKAKQVELPNSSCNCACESSQQANEDGEAQGGRKTSESLNIGQEEYEEDHADEEIMFTSIDNQLSNLRDALSGAAKESASDAAKQLLKSTKNLRHHLMKHLDKEEQHCMPLVAQYLTKDEIHSLVGHIMGKRSSDLMSQILTLAVQNLKESEREDMVRYMKEAMVGTFFERWLKVAMPKQEKDVCDDGGGKMSADLLSSEGSSAPGEGDKPAPANDNNNVTVDPCYSKSSPDSTPPHLRDLSRKYTSAAELEKLIRAVGTNPHLDTKQKNVTIQGLRDSVWTSNVRLSKRKREEETSLNGSEQPSAKAIASIPSSAAYNNRACGKPTYSAFMEHQAVCKPAPMASRFKRNTPPSAYYKLDETGKEAVLVWSSDPNSSKYFPDEQVPLFSASELAPTYHDGGINRTLGCPHYARSCKLRHPTSGKLYTCRLCCEQHREMTTESANREVPLDRYEVKEILCMICNTLQPAGEKCCNPACGSNNKLFAKYSCQICHLYDDSDKSIYHCPFCNVCRKGRGLGIDFKHCMRCNACVSMDEEHVCIPQSLQGNCPICHESMFESTQPLRRLKCGHVMHLSCFTTYAASGNYTCPLCKKSVDDMSEYFALLDSAVRMQPMPLQYVDQSSNIYCQDCGKMGNVSYHFVGLKCQHCGSYNTRELQRVDPLSDYD
mmetsp:Transcript_22397/g.49762  ORF Transcript_22397/g.49762 Transcript_22397/m.49762 type:complete len:760 (+) Transcript_22397:292-2571(+)